MIATVLEHPTRLRLSLRVQPRAARSRIAGVHGEALKVQLAAPPVDGAANAALIEFLAEILEVPGSAIRIVTGERARSKVVEVAADDIPPLLTRLGLAEPAR